MPSQRSRIFFDQLGSLFLNHISLGVIGFQQGRTVVDDLFSYVLISQLGYVLYADALPPSGFRIEGAATGACGERLGQGFHAGPERGEVGGVRCSVPKPDDTTHGFKQDRVNFAYLHIGMTIIVNGARELIVVPAQVNFQ